MDSKIKIGLPLTALIFCVTPFIFYFLGRINDTFAVLFFVSILMPIFGIILGVTSIGMGKKKIGAAGMIISITAVALPPGFILSVILLVQTGAVVIGM